jgi:hypothetical protein
LLIRLQHFEDYVPLCAEYVSEAAVSSSGAALSLSIQQTKQVKFLQQLF